MQLFFDDCYQHINGYCNPGPCFDCIFTVAVKRFDSQMLLHPLEELDDEIASWGIYMYRGDSTTLNLDELDDHQIVQFCNYRTEVIEIPPTALEASARH